MLRKLLSLLRTEGHLTKEDLSHALGVREDTVEAMLGELMARGYLQDLACATRVGMAHACAGCAQRKGCHIGAPHHVWALTEKGCRAIQRQETNEVPRL